MSWSFYMEIDTGGLKPHGIDYDINETYNVAGIYFAAFKWPRRKKEKGIRGIEGMTGKKARKPIAKAIKRMEKRPEHYEGLVHGGGTWGNYEGALQTLNDLHSAAVKNPKAVFRIC